MSIIKEALVPRVVEPLTAFELLDRVCQAITEEPKRLIMSDWIVAGERLERWFSKEEEANMPNCGTAGCIAGWVNILTRPRPVETALETYNFGSPGQAVETLIGPYPNHDSPHYYEWLEAQQRLDGSGVGLFYSFPPDEFKQGTAEHAAYMVEQVQRFQRDFEALLRARVVTPKYPA